MIDMDPLSSTPVQSGFSTLKGEAKSVISDVVRTLIHRHPHEWSALKGQIFELGYQATYAEVVEFLEPAERALERLAPDKGRPLRLRGGSVTRIAPKATIHD